MSSTPVKTDPSLSAPAEACNRVTLGWSNRLLARPEIGALVAAVVIFIFFLIVAPAFRTPASFFTVLYQSSTIGIGHNRSPPESPAAASDWRNRSVGA